MTKEELASDYLKKWLNGDIYHSASHSPSNCFHDGFLTGYSAAESEIKKRDALIAEMLKELEFFYNNYTDDASMNHIEGLLAWKSEREK